MKDETKSASKGGFKYPVRMGGACEKERGRRRSLKFNERRDPYSAVSWMKDRVERKGPRQKELMIYPKF